MWRLKIKIFFTDAEGVRLKNENGEDTNEYEIKTFQVPLFSNYSDMKKFMEREFVQGPGSPNYVIHNTHWKRLDLNEESNFKAFRHSFGVDGIDTNEDDGKHDKKHGSDVWLLEVNHERVYSYFSVLKHMLLG
jgi:hypothetical protein